MPCAVVAGHVCIDMLPTFTSDPTVTPGALAEVGALEMRAGGCVAGTGTALAELGSSTSLVADIGDDELGALLFTMLSRSDARTHDVVHQAATSTSYSIVIETDGADRSFWHHVGANATFDGTDVNLASADLLHLGYLSLLPALYADSGKRCRELFERATGLGVTTSLALATIDPHSEAAEIDWLDLFTGLLPVTDIITPSTDDIATALGGPTGTEPDDLQAIAQQLVDLGAAVVMLTAGRAGLLLMTGDTDRLERAGLSLAEHADDWAHRTLWVPAVDVPVLSATGAGDAATAGLLHALLQGDGPEGAALSACRAAGARISGRPLAAVADLRPSSTTMPTGWSLTDSGVVRGPGDTQDPNRQEQTS